MQTDTSRQPSRPTRLEDVGVVAIGRNEGERLRRCLEALPPGLRHAVYVDSSSTDDSVDQARRRGIEVLELDMSTPFTAARARNAGLRRMHERWPGLSFVQFIDGDCILVPGWLDAAILELESNPRVAMVCGRRREVHPDASPYNRLCDTEWDTPLGDALSCGGDALARVAAVLEVSGYDERLIAGEEPELCARLRARGWTVRRIDVEMTLHDAGMLRFAQWWRRALRSGHGVAEVNAMQPALWRREVCSIVTWGMLVPAATLVATPVTSGRGLALLLAYPVLWASITARRHARGDSLRDGALYASFSVLGKFGEVAGMAKYWWNRCRRRRSRLIEYK